MAVMYVRGVCVGLSDETIKYTNGEGKQDSFRSITATFADPGGIGSPLEVQIGEGQKAYLKPFESFYFPVEVRTSLNKRTGAPISRIHIVENAPIERVPNANAGTPANPSGK